MDMGHLANTAWGYHQVANVVNYLPRGKCGGRMILIPQVVFSEGAR
jgi:hypothetical protein